MPTSVTFLSPSDEKSNVLITYEHRWTNARIYVDGALIETIKTPKQLKEGFTVSHERLGQITIKLHPATLIAKLSVDGVQFAADKPQQRMTETLNGVVAVFVGLALLNLFVFIVSLIGLADGPIYAETQAFVVMFGFFTLVYSLTFIFIMRGAYWFYFIGTGTFTLTSIFVIAQLAEYLSAVTILIILSRLLLLAVLYRFLPRVLNFLKNAQNNNDSADLIDEVI